MDITKEYIKMCEKFPSNKQKFELGDFFYCYKDEKVKVLTDFKLIMTSLTPTKLFRQDQLQEMVKGRGNSTSMGMARQFSDAIWGKQYERLLFSSMEQLWLAFVMKELYQKTWNGTDWVK